MASSIWTKALHYLYLNVILAYRVSLHKLKYLATKLHRADAQFSTMTCRESHTTTKGYKLTTIFFVNYKKHESNIKMLICGKMIEPGQSRSPGFWFPFFFPIFEEIPSGFRTPSDWFWVGIKLQATSEVIISLSYQQQFVLWNWARLQENILFLSVVKPGVWIKETVVLLDLLICCCSVKYGIEITAICLIIKQLFFRCCCLRILSGGEFIILKNKTIMLNTKISKVIQFNVSGLDLVKTLCIDALPV